MLIPIQIIICPLALSILSSLIWRQVTTYDTRTGILGLNVKDPDHYTETEKGKIQLLRESVDDVLVKDYQRSDDFLIRWLREFGMNIKSANQSLRYAMKWREENQMDFILNKTLHALAKKQLTCIVEGLDKRAEPILYFGGTDWNLRDHLLNGLSEQFLHYMYICTERFFQAGIKNGVNGKQVGVAVTPGVGIIDVRGSTMKQHVCLRCVEFYCRAIVNINKIYTGAAKLIVIINVPPFGKKVFDVIWPFLSQNLIETIRIFGTDRQEWTKFLLTIIPEDFLQEFGKIQQSDIKRN